MTVATLARITPPCTRCTRLTYPRRTHPHSRPPGAVPYGGRILCSSCYTWCSRYDKARLLALPFLTTLNPPPTLATVTAKLTPDCERCARPTISHRIPRGQRPPGAMVYGSRGMCSSCCSWLRRNDPDALLDHECRNRPNDEVLEEYEIMRKAYGGSLRQIAEHMNISRRMLYQALYRARCREKEALAVNVQEGIAA